MSWGLITLILIAIFAAILIVYRKNPYVKKYWKYALILVPGVIIIVFRLLGSVKTNKQTKDDNAGAKTVEAAVTQISKDIKETQLVAAVEVAVAKTKSADKIQKLVEIKKIVDQDEKIKQLAELVG
jgi:glucan phosphoethanolaminetransferase (alkaline phosphatase superfamily)